ncbi:hypothetical protein [Ferruginibacter sp. SUN106]|uniref:hypothetical protein n=1 Tax=Ferruginibacter sp. SUN106 TaxID=2978348 RepID=UPI003D36CC9E
MLSEKQFNNDDVQIIETMLSRFKGRVVICSIISVPLSMLLGLLGLLTKEYGYWPVTITFYIAMAVVFMWILIKDQVAYRKDLSKQVKLCGQLTVVKKSLKNGYADIYTNDKQLKKLHIRNKKIVDNILEGDVLTVEIAKYSNKLLLLEK